MKEFYVNVFLTTINTRAEKKYRPSIYPGKITFFQATAEVERDPGRFWGNLTSAGIEVHMVPATHMDILVESQRAECSPRSSMPHSKRPEGNPDSVVAQ